MQFGSPLRLGLKAREKKVHGRADLPLGAKHCIKMRALLRNVAVGGPCLREEVTERM